MNMARWRGYIFSRDIGGHAVPQRVQNLVIRTCAERHGLTYLLSTTEYYMDDCYMMLQSALEELGEIEGIIFYSTHQLPSHAAERMKLYEKVLSSKGGLRFALEGLAFLGRDDIKLIEDLITCHDLNDQVIDLDTYKDWLN
jgi:sporadic carbohydrate cluster protein (TIGR04323 family)